MVREALWDYFVDIRRSLATTISPKIVKAKAQQIADTLTKEMGETGVYIEVPKINYDWLRRWRHDYGVVWRKPNARYKVSFPKLKARLRATWTNNIRIRRLAELTLGHDLSGRIIGVDEKPLHFNESGSKNVSTLEIDLPRVLNLGGYCMWVAPSPRFAPSPKPWIRLIRSYCTSPWWLYSTLG